MQLYLGIVGEQLRFFTPEGEFVPTPEEAEAQERQRVEEAEARAEAERQRAERLLQRLEELGIEPDELNQK